MRNSIGACARRNAEKAVTTGGTDAGRRDLEMVDCGLGAREDEALKRIDDVASSLREVTRLHAAAGRSECAWGCDRTPKKYVSCPRGVAIGTVPTISNPLVGVPEAEAGKNDCSAILFA